MPHRRERPPPDPRPAGPPDDQVPATWRPRDPRLLPGPLGELVALLDSFRLAELLDPALSLALEHLVKQLSRRAPDPAAGAPLLLLAKRWADMSTPEARARAEEIMLATAPRGPMASGPGFDALASTLAYAPAKLRAFRAGRVSDRELAALHVRHLGLWAAWRASTGDDVDLGALEHGMVQVLTRYCGAVPGWG